MSLNRRSAVIGKRGAVPIALSATVTFALLAGCADTETPPTLGPATPLASPSTSSPTPTPSASHGASPTPTPQPSSPAPSMSPGPQPSPSPSKLAAPAPMIVIDPGHSGKSIRSIDPKTGLHDIDYPNYPEIYEMFDVSYCVGRGLRQDGYRVTLTKTEPLASVGLAKRAAIANRAEADLAISVHNDHSQRANFQATYSQLGTQGHAMYRGRGKNRTVFTHRAVAKKSAAYAQVIATQRSKTQQREVSIRENIFTGRAPLEPGNLALVQLLADVPWVYNEMGALTNGKTTTAISMSSETAYAKGLLLGVEASVPLKSGRVAQPSAGAKSLQRCLVDRLDPDSGPARPKRYRPAGS